MSRFILIGNYIEEYKFNEIYYDQVLDKFYALPYDFFEKQKKELEYLDELLSENYEDSDIKEYEITNKDEIKGLKFIVNYNKEKFYENEHQKAEDEIDKNKKISPYKKALIGCIVVFAASYLIYNHFEPTIKSKFNSCVESLSNKEETKEKYLVEVSDAIELNTSIPEDIKVLWLNDFAYLFNSDIFMTNSQVKGIVKRINDGNFGDVDDDNQIFELSRIIFDSDYSIYVGIIYQIDDLANEKDYIRAFNEYYLLGYLSLGVKEDLLKETILLGKDKYIDIVAETYGVTPKEIKELTDLIDKYYRGSREEQKEAYAEFKKKLGDMLIRYYQNKGKLNEYEKFVLVSDIYNSGISLASDIVKTVAIDNNMFNDYIIVKVRDQQYGNYNLYFDSKTHNNITESVYQEKLIKLLETKGSNLDYNDPDARFLVYLYILSYKDKIYMKDKRELFTSETSEELANYITRSIFDIYDDVKMNPEFLYSYLSNGKVNFDEMFGEINYFFGDSLSVSLFIEYARCLKHEMLDGRLSQEAYEEEYKELKKRTLDDDEIIEFVDKAINNDESIFSYFSLPISSIEYSNDEIKKYTKEPREY